MRQRRFPPRTRARYRIVKNRHVFFPAAFATYTAASASANNDVAVVCALLNAIPVEHESPAARTAA